MASDGVLNLCSVKGFRIPKELCVVLGLLLGKGLEFAFIVFTHDVEYADEDIVTQASVTIQTNKLAFLVAHNTVTVTKTDKFNQSLIVSSNTDRFLQGIHRQQYRQGQ